MASAAGTQPIPRATGSARLLPPARRPPVSSTSFSVSVPGRILVVREPNQRIRAELFVLVRLARDQRQVLCRNDLVGINVVLGNEAFAPDDAWAALEVDFGHDAHAVSPRSATCDGPRGRCTERVATAADHVDQGWIQYEMRTLR